MHVSTIKFCVYEVPADFLLGLPGERIRKVVRYTPNWHGGRACKDVKLSYRKNPM